MVGQLIGRYPGRVYVSWTLYSSHELRTYDHIFNGRIAE